MLHSSNWTHLHFGSQTWQWNPHHFRIYFHSNLFNYTSGTPFWTLNFHRLRSCRPHQRKKRTSRTAQVLDDFTFQHENSWDLVKLQCFFGGVVSRCDKLWKTKGVGHGGQSFLIYIQSFLWSRGVFLNSWGFAKWQDSSLNMDLHGSWSELWGPASEKKKTFQSSCKRRGRGSHGWALTTPPRGKEAARGGSHGDWVTQPAMDGFDGLFMWIRQ